MKICFYAIILIINIIKSKKLLISQNEEEKLIDINIEIEREYDINPNTSYTFIINNDKYLYSFSSLLDNIFFVKNQE